MNNADGRQVTPIHRPTQSSLSDLMRKQDVGFYRVGRSARGKHIARHKGESMLGMMIRLGAKAPTK